MGRGRGRSRPSSPSTASVGARSSVLCTIWQQTGDNAARRHAYHEARWLPSRKGLALLADPPRQPRAHPARTHAAPHPGGAPESRRRARQLRKSARSIPGPTRCVTRWGSRCNSLPGPPRPLSGFISPRHRCTTAGELAQQVTDLAQRQHNAGLVLAGQAAVGAVALLSWRPPWSPGHTWSTICRLTDTSRLSVPRLSLVSIMLRVTLPRLDDAGSLGVGLCRPGPAAECRRRWLWPSSASIPPRLAYAESLCAILSPVSPGCSGHVRPCERVDGLRHCARLGAPRLSWDASCGGGRWPCRATRPPA